MTAHEPHVGDIYASNDPRNIESNHLQHRRVTEVNTNHVCFDGGTRGVTRRMLDTGARRGYRLVDCAGDTFAPERTYTREDMARARDEGHSWGWQDARDKAQAVWGVEIGERREWRLCTPNPYEKLPGIQ